MTTEPRRGQRPPTRDRDPRRRRTAQFFGRRDAPGSARGRARRLADAVVLGIAVALGLVAAALVTTSFASFASIKAHLDSFASDGDADVTRAEFDAIVVRLRVAAVIAAVAAVAIYGSRRRLARFLHELAASAEEAVSSLWHGVTAALARESRLHLGALAMVTLAALLVRLEFLFQPMRYDESATYVSYASVPWYIAVTDYTAPNNHVLHSLLVHLSTLLFGGEPWAIRFPALAAGVLLVPATYVCARAFYGRDAALVGAGLVAGSSVLVEYSTNARGYTLLALVFLLLLALATHLRQSWNPAEWLAFAVLGALGFYLVPVMLYAFGAVVVWLALSTDRRLAARRLAPAIVVTAVLGALLYAPIVAASGLGSLVSNEFVEPLSWSSFTSELPGSLESVVRGWHRDVPLPLAIALGAAFVAGIVFHRRVSRFAVPPALAAVAWIVPLVVLQRVVPFERVWLFLVPLYLMTASAGLVLGLRPIAPRVGTSRAVVPVLAVALAGLLAASAVASQSVYESEETSTFRDGKPVAAFLHDRLRRDDKVLVKPPADAILEYHLMRRELDPAALLYWAEPGPTRRFLIVVKEGPKEYPLEYVLADERLNGTPLGEPRLLRRYDEATVYEVRRAG